MKLINNIFILFIVFSGIKAELVQTTLEDYAYDFASIGHEISFFATSAYFIPMSADDYFNASYGGYTLEVRINALSRKAKKDFVPYYNKNCETTFSGDDCKIFLEGEIELNSSMKMILKAKKINFLSPDGSKIITSFK